MSLASRSASSSVLNVGTGATGPKISSSKTRASLGHVGQHGRRVVEALVAGAAAAGEHPRRRGRWRPARSSATLSRCLSSISGPTSTPSSVPRPTVSAPIRSASRSENSSATDSCTMNRLAAVQASPMLRILASIAPSTALSRSASPKTRNGALPPSSIDTRSRPSADCSTSLRAHRGRAGEGELAQPRVADQRLHHLAGVRRRDDVEHALRQAALGEDLRPGPASTAASATAGLTTIVQPAAMAGPILRVPMASGKFHGVIISAGPTGCFIVSSRVAPLGTSTSGRRCARPPRRTSGRTRRRR